MEKKNLTCIGCPMGCQITVEVEGEDKLSGTCRIYESAAYAPQKYVILIISYF